MQKTFEGSKKALEKHLKLKIVVAAPFNAMAVAAEISNLKVGQATRIISIFISGEKCLSLTDMHGYGLGMKKMYFDLREVSDKKVNNSNKERFDYDLVENYFEFNSFCIKFFFHKRKSTADESHLDCKRCRKQYKKHYIESRE